METHVTNKPLADVWASRDFPVLTAAVRWIDSGQLGGVHDVSLAEATELSVADVRLALKALERRGLITTSSFLSGDMHVDEIAGDAYLLTGLHPDGDDALEQLISTLRQAADQTSDPEEKSQLRKAAGALGGLAGKVGTSVMTAYVTGMLPGQ